MDEELRRRIVLEMAYTSYEYACKDPTLTMSGEPRECRRLDGHEPPHASDHPFYWWGTQ